jgi:hypothetical protein
LHEDKYAHDASKSYNHPYPYFHPRGVYPLSGKRMLSPLEQKKVRTGPKVPNRKADLMKYPWKWYT